MDLEEAAPPPRERVRIEYSSETTDGECGAAGAPSSALRPSLRLSASSPPTKNASHPSPKGQMARVIRVARCAASQRVLFGDVFHGGDLLNCLSPLHFDGQCPVPSVATNLPHAPEDESQGF